MNKTKKEKKEIAKDIVDNITETNSFEDMIDKYKYHVFFSWGLDDGKHKIIEFLKYTSKDVRKELSENIVQNCKNENDTNTNILSEMKKQIIEFKVKSVYKQASLHFFHSNSDWDTSKLQTYLEEDEVRRLRTLEESQIAI